MKLLNGMASAVFVHKSIKSIIIPDEDAKTPVVKSTAKARNGNMVLQKESIKIITPKGTISEAIAITGMFINMANTGRQLKIYIVSGSMHA